MIQMTNYVLSRMQQYSFTHSLVKIKVLGLLLRHNRLYTVQY